ncbi:TPA: hypothetical protein LES10_001953 [Listeria monocytogenes]|nr:hypothetical protein [Listeria monocytogenes]EAG2513389.1 hypothetical protein [Listeria monocytogenes]EAH3080857.1 hypothetical protein [Listeria monocytogenes]EBA3706063.1 hypothetical protein [Listeria monocytogenes]EDN9428640.1 hypothetical protein [Listeria monocytogenes]
MKRMLTLAILCIALVLTGCGTDSVKEDTKDTKDTAGNKKNKVTATSTLDSFVNADIPMYKNVVFTEETDPNELLGRPNSYIAKIDFNDKSAIDRIAAKNIEDLGLEESDKGDQVQQLISDRTGGTIEEFKTEKDLQNRLEYLQDLPVKSNVDNEYRYSSGKVLLRIDSALTPSEAESYEKAFLNQ